jgi:hypothetical protein
MQLVAQVMKFGEAMTLGNSAISSLGVAKA